MRIKELASVAIFSRMLSWNHKNHSSPLKVREVGGSRRPLGLIVSF